MNLAINTGDEITEEALNGFVREGKRKGSNVFKQGFG